MSDTAEVAPSLLSALLAVQGEAPTLPKDALNPHFRSKYTPLDTIVEVVGPILNRHGLVWMTLPGHDESGHVLTYRLAHAPTGEVLEGTMPLLLAKVDAQGLGSAITYARRYALCSVLNLVADDDDDGNIAASARAASKPAAKPAAPVRHPALKAQFRKHNLKAGAIRDLVRASGFTISDNGLVTAAVDALTDEQAAGIVAVLERGPVPTGKSDVPSDASGFTHPSSGGDVPFDAAESARIDEATA